MIPIHHLLQDPKFIANPYPVYDKLRQVHPLYFNTHENSWILTRYEDIKFVLSDKRFEFPQRPHKQSSTLRSWEQMLSAEIDPLAFLQLRQKCKELSKLWIINESSSHQTNIKRVITNNFLPKNIEIFRAKIQSMANKLVDGVLSKKQFDIVTDIASPLPIMVICEITKISPEDMLPNFDNWAKNIIDGIEIGATAIAKEKSIMATIALCKHLSQLLNERQNNLQQDPLSSLIQAYLQKQMDADELLANSIFLLLAGVVTAQRMIAKGLLTLLQHPRQKQKLQENPHLISLAAEECLRYEPPKQFSIRVANKDVTLADKQIKKGQKLYLFLAAANRDPQTFCEPNKFDITRDPNPHLTFGIGRHFCPGAYLGRLETQVALATLLKRLPNLALANENSFVWEMGLRKHGLKSLTVII